MAVLLSDILTRVRRDLGDEGKPFQTTVRGDGVTTRFELPEERVSATGLLVYKVDGAGSTSTFSTPADYILDEQNGILTLAGTLQETDNLYVQGTYYSLFSDAELTVYVQDALVKHTHGRDVSVRVRHQNGFIGYVRAPMDLTNLPEIEEPLLGYLATIDALWTLSIDAATDIDISTAEGTSIPRSQRWKQIMDEINLLQARYQQLCQQLNVGFYRIEMTNLRRVSRTTGFLVPVFVEREYDDHSWPTRILPQIDHGDEDMSGISSPGTWYGY